MGMLRSVGSKVAWVGRTASMVFGLALMLALVVGVASAAFGANGQAWILGQSNVATAITRLAGTAGVDGPMLQLINNNEGTNDTALDLRVQSGEAPMRVNSSTRVANLNAARAGRADSAASADTATNAQNAANAAKLDGKDSTEFAQRLDSGTITLNFSSIPAHSCQYIAVNPSGVDDISNDVVAVTPGYNVGTDSTGLSFYAARSTSSAFFRIVACNVTTTAVNPASDNYHWMVFHQT